MGERKKRKELTEHSNENQKNPPSARGEGSSRKKDGQKIRESVSKVLGIRSSKRVGGERREGTIPAWGTTKGEIPSGVKKIEGRAAQRSQRVGRRQNLTEKKGLQRTIQEKIHAGGFEAHRTLRGRRGNEKNFGESNLLKQNPGKKSDQSRTGSLTCGWVKQVKRDRNTKGVARKEKNNWRKKTPKSHVAGGFSKVLKQGKTTGGVQRDISGGSTTAVQQDKKVEKENRKKGDCPTKKTHLNRLEK